MSNSHKQFSSSKEAPIFPSAAQRSLVPQAPSGRSNPEASAQAYQEMQDKRARAMADPQQVLSRQNMASSSEQHRRMIAQYDETNDQQSYHAEDYMSKLKRRHQQDPESPGKKRGSLEPHERGASIRHEDDRSRYSTPVIAFSRSPSHHPPAQSAHTLGPPIDLQYSQDASEGSSRHPIQVSPGNSPAGARPIKEWDDHDVQAVTKEESVDDQAYISERRQGKAKANPTKPKTRGKAKAPAYVDFDPFAHELPPVKAATQTGKTLISEYFSGDSFDPPNLFASAADASNYTQAAHAGSAIASSHIALLDLQVQLHILQTMLTSQEIKRQTLNLQLADRGRTPMTFRGFLPDPVDRLDDVYNLIAAKHNMRGTALDPAQTVTLYGLVRHVLKTREEHGIPAVTVQGGLPLHPVATWDDANHQSGRVWEDAQESTRIGDDDEDGYYDLVPKSVALSPSRIPRRALPTPVSTTRQSSGRGHESHPPAEYHSARPPSAASSTRASGTTSRHPAHSAEDHYDHNRRPPTTHNSARPPSAASSTRESGSHHNGPPAKHHSAATRVSGTSSHRNTRPPSAESSSKTSVKPGSRSSGNVYKVPRSTK